MIRAAAFTFLLLTLGAQAEECATLLPLTGTWRSETGYLEIFGRRTFSYQRPDMASPAPLRIVKSGHVEKPDDVALDCATLDGAGIARLVADWEDYAAMMKDGPAYTAEMSDIAAVKKLLTHPPYRLVTATYYEGAAYYIRVDKSRLIAVETSEAQLSLVTYEEQKK